MFQSTWRPLALTGLIAGAVMHVAPAAACPTVSSISPSSGPAAGGTSVTSSCPMPKKANRYRCFLRLSQAA